MQFLIQAEWVQQEADEQGIEVSDKAVQKSFEDQKKQAFPTDKAYQEFLKTSGMTEEDILFRVKLDQLQQKLTQKVTEDAKKVSDEDIQEYYEKNKERFAQPERRDLHVVLTKTEAKADEAREALEDGDSPGRRSSRSTRSTRPRRPRAASCRPWPRASRRRRSTRPSSPPRRASSRARSRPSSAGTCSRSTKITPASQQSLEQSKDTIKNLLRSERQQKALDDVHQGLPRGVQGRDGLRRRLPRRRVRERAEGRRATPVPPRAATRGGQPQAAQPAPHAEQPVPEQ